MKRIFQKLTRMLENPMADNLFLTSILIRILSIPCSVMDEESFLLHYFLIEPTTTASKTGAQIGLISILRKVNMSRIYIS